MSTNTTSPAPVSISFIGGASASGHIAETPASLRHHISIVSARVDELHAEIDAHQAAAAGTVSVGGLNPMQHAIRLRHAVVNLRHESRLLERLQQRLAAAE